MLDRGDAADLMDLVRHERGLSKLDAERRAVDGPGQDLVRPASSTSAAVFALLPWMSNLLSVSLVVAISFLLHQFAHKVLARMNGFDTEYSLWGVQRFSLSPYVLFGKSLKAKPFPRKIKLFVEHMVKKASVPS